MNSVNCVTRDARAAIPPPATLHCAHRLFVLSGRSENQIDFSLFCAEENSYWRNPRSQFVYTQLRDDKNYTTLLCAMMKDSKCYIVDFFFLECELTVNLKKVITNYHR